MFSNKNQPKSSHKYSCDACQYYSGKKTNYEEHLMTRKHKLSIISNKIQPNPATKFSCVNCGKEYKDNSGLWRHKKKCINELDNLKSELANEEKQQQLVEYLLKENSEFKQLMIEHDKHMMELSQKAANNNNNINSNNKTFNLQVSDRCELIRIASPMHDIGKIGTPDHILLKPGKFSPEEFEVITRHSEMGRHILDGSRAELLKLAAMIAWTHHEKFDGTGYPRKLSGEAIPLEGRIAAIADTFDALTTKRVYKPAYSVDQTLDIMRESRESISIRPCSTPSLAPWTKCWSSRTGSATRWNQPDTGKGQAPAFAGLRRVPVPVLPP